ncbi:MAG: radical SAM protein [Desulfurococcaceae archaeon]
MARLPGLDPFKLAEEVREKAVRREGGSELRRYYRFRGARWYGGIATGDVVGCNLRCKFCWSWRYSFFPDRGELYSPEEVARRLASIARSRGYKYARLSGGEPTISFEHAVEVARRLERENLTFILETNGLLIGLYKDYARELAGLRNVVVRVSFKGTTPGEFSMLTGAREEFFEYQFRALENMLEAGMEPGRDFYAAAMLSFSPEENVRKFVERLKRIDPALGRNLDAEYVILYPHVVDLLRRSGLRPRISYRPDGVPESMI